METPASSEYHEHYHNDASEHGFIWYLIHEVLHGLVFVYVCYGLISFRVKFMSSNRVYNLVHYFVRTFVVIYNCCLALRMFTIAYLLYYLDQQLPRGYKLSQKFNCTALTDFSIERELSQHESDHVRAQILYASSHELTHNESLLVPIVRPRHASLYAYVTLNNLYRSQLNMEMAEYVGTFMNVLAHHYMRGFARVLDVIAGPYMWGGKQTILMYGFYGLGIFVMSVVFPIEHMLRSSINYNFIKFTLSDTKLLDECRRYQATLLRKLDDHIESETSSPLTHTCRALDYRQVRVDAFKIKNKMWRMPRFRCCQPPWRSPIASICDAHERPVTRPMQNSRIARRNVRRYKPFVRSKSWFKICLVAYPVFLAYNFILVLALTIWISFKLNGHVARINAQCPLTQRFSDMAAGGGGTPPIYYRVDFFYDDRPYLSWLSVLSWIESYYMAYLMSMAPAFYMSYYVGTICELFLWMSELRLQLGIAKVLLEMGNKLSEDLGVQSDELELDFDWHEGNADSAHAQYARQAIDRVMAWRHGQHIDIDYVDSIYTQFGGVRDLIPFLWYCWQSRDHCARMREVMAFRLRAKKYSVVYSAFMNVQFFYRDFKATRVMMVLVLQRTCLMAVGAACMTAVCRTQFDLDVLALNLLMLVCYLTLMIYTGLATMMGSRMSKFTNMFHSVQCAGLAATATGATDLHEVALRHLLITEPHDDTMLYAFFGVKATYEEVWEVSIVANRSLFAMQLSNNRAYAHTHAHTVEQQLDTNVHKHGV